MNPEPLSDREIMAALSLIASGSIDYWQFSSQARTFLLPIEPSAGFGPQVGNHLQGLFAAFPLQSARF